MQEGGDVIIEMEEEESTAEDTPVVPDSPYVVHMETRQRTPDMAVQRFDGGFEAVKAREVKVRACTMPMAKFLISFIVVTMTLIGCGILLFVNGFEQPGAAWLQTMIGFCVGVFLPNPQSQLQARRDAAQ